VNTEMTSQQWSMTVTPVVAAVTTLCAATALSGVIDGLRWLGYAGVAVVVVTAIGLGLRAIRTPVLVVGLAQMFAVLCLLVALFTNTGILGILPGPAAISELGDVLRRSVEVVRTGVPPVDATAAVLCLVVIAIGLVAVLVDTLAVAAGTPAASGLVLLCVYAVPASLADDMLPWWSFVLGAGSFALLLAVDGAHRHQKWRNRPALPGTGAGAGSPAAHVTAALLLALIAGGTITAIGTVGHLPGGQGGTGAGGLGLKPFTTLRGFLDQGTNRELFRVRGLGNEARYMREMTLPTYDKNGGWSLRPKMPRGVPVTGDLPLAPGSRAPGKTTRIDVETISYDDLWAGVYGTPRRFQGLPSGMQYDSASGMVYSENKRRLPRFYQDVDLTLPSGEDLRSAGTNYNGLDPIYFEKGDIDPKVVAMANNITSGLSNPYDKAAALEKFFDGNGFTYQLQTASGSDETALVDFLVRNRAGFCEQYASAMAIMARAAGLPSRVAIGYTGGFVSGDYRSITTQDAHAWVEIYFPGQGWTQFDPTPLTDGRTYTPPYATESAGAVPSDDPTTSETDSTNPSEESPAAGKEDRPDPDAGGGALTPESQTQDRSWLWWTAGGTALLASLFSLLALLAARGRLDGWPPWARSPLTVVALVLWLAALALAAGSLSWWLTALIAAIGVVAAPAAVRAWQRRRRRHVVHSNEPTAASAAWAELMAESVDRGTELIPAETVRTTARRLAHEHDLDDDSKQALRTVVGAVERSWYSGRDTPDPGLATAFDELLTGLRRSAPLALRARLLPRSILRRAQFGGA
jgi:transglutaminase-like putative cysteine protease